MSSYLLDARAGGGGGGLQEVTLADVAGFSVTTPDQTFSLNAATQVDFVASGGVIPILQIGEATKHIAVGPDALVDGGAIMDPTAVILSVQESYSGVLDYHVGVEIGIEADPSASDAFVLGLDSNIKIPASNSEDNGYYQSLNFATEYSGSGTGINLHGAQGFSYQYGGSSSFTVGMYVGVYTANLGTHAAQTVGVYIDNSIFSGATADENIGLYIVPISGATSNKAIETNAGHVVFNEGSDNTMKFRTEGATDQNLLVTDGPNDAVCVGAASRGDSAKFYVAGKISTSGEVEVNGDLNHDGSNIGLFGTAPTTKKTVTGSRGGNAALASLLTQLAAYGLITDSTSA